jgi:hypothetical protein
MTPILLFLLSGCFLAIAPEPSGFNWDQMFSSMFSGAGVAGVILGYYLWKLGPLLEGIKDEIRQTRIAQERAKRADLIRITVSPHVHPGLKSEAAALIAEIDRAEVATSEHSID